MPNYRAQVTLTTTDNTAANYITNTWYFDADDNTELGNAEAAMWDVYEAMSPHLSALLNQDDHIIKWYDMNDPEPRAPVRENTLDLAAGTRTGSLPPEVALCLSYQGARVSGLPQARRRGRVYIGPFEAAAVGTDGRPISTIVTALRNAGAALLAASDAAATWTWIQFSTVNDGFADVDNGWVDNEFDTQRRRGRPYTSRSTFS